MAGHLPTDTDILDACHWRLSGVSAEQVQSEMATVRQWLASLPSFEHIDENDPETSAIIEQLKRPNDKRKPWGLLVALIALEGHRNDDRTLFYRAGYVAIQIHAQASRRACKRCGEDDLSTLIKALLIDQPDAPTVYVADELSELAGNYAYSALVDFDSDTQTLTYLPSEDSDLKDIHRPALYRKIQRVRSALQ